MNKLKLRIKWDPKEQDFMAYYPRKSDGGWLLDRIVGKRRITTADASAKNDKALTRICGLDWNPYLGLYELDFIQELISRGFDKTTLKFEVMIDLNKLASDFSHLLEDLTDTERTRLNKILKKNKIKLSTN